MIVKAHYTSFTDGTSFQGWVGIFNNLFVCKNGRPSDSKTVMTKEELRIAVLEMSKRLKSKVLIDFTYEPLNK